MQVVYPYLCPFGRCCQHIAESQSSKLYEIPALFAANIWHSSPHLPTALAEQALWPRHKVRVGNWCFLWAGNSLQGKAHGAAHIYGGEPTLTFKGAKFLSPDNVMLSRICSLASRIPSLTIRGAIGSSFTLPTKLLLPRFPRITISIYRLLYKILRH